MAVAGPLAASLVERCDNHLRNRRLPFRPPLRHLLPPAAQKGELPGKPLRRRTQRKAGCQIQRKCNHQPCQDGCAGRIQQVHQRLRHHQALGAGQRKRPHPQGVQRQQSHARRRKHQPEQHPGSLHHSRAYLVRAHPRHAHAPDHQRNQQGRNADGLQCQIGAIGSQQPRPIARRMRRIQPAADRVQRRIGGMVRQKREEEDAGCGNHGQPEDLIQAAAARGRVRQALRLHNRGARRCQTCQKGSRATERNTRAT